MQFEFECDIDKKNSLRKFAEKFVPRTDVATREKLSENFNWTNTAALTTTGIMYIESMDSLSSLMSIRRHYKKDSRYINDLYKLTFDNQESLYMTNELVSLHNSINSYDDVQNEHVSYPMLYKNHFVLVQKSICWTLEVPIARLISEIRDVTYDISLEWEKA